MGNQPANNAAEYENLVNDCLRVIARFTRAGRAHLLFLTRTDKFKKNFYSWAEEPPPSAQGCEGPLRLSSSWWLRALRTSQVLRIDAVEQLPDDLTSDRQALLEHGIRALMLLPVYDGKRLVGTVRIENPAFLPGAPGPELDLLQIAAQLTVRVLKVSVEMAELKRDRARLAYQNSHDEQTRLPNKALFLERIRSAFEANENLFAVLLVEFDYYQLIHECLGGEAGREIVLSAVNVLRSNLRTTDMIARLGEDEFGILLEDLQDPTYAETIAARILERLKQPILLGGQRINIAASIGIALRNGHQRTADLILQEAGIALIQARHNLGSRYLLFDLSMRDQLINRMEMETDLRGSLEHQQLILHYQPITELKTGRLIGFEALVRWMHPQRGMIWPVDFIHLSEETGLIVPLGLWVLREACRQMRLWQDTYPIDPLLMISVNISPRQLEQPDFSAQVARILEETGLPPTCLRLEITESTIVNSSCTVMQALEALRSLGVQLYIDDFGTGYSSLGYLDSLPIDAIKIDRSFVNNLGRVKSSAGVVQAIIQLAHELNIEVVAEGVETLEQHKELKRLRCEFMQGFYISEPLDTSAVERYITCRKLQPHLAA